MLWINPEKNLMVFDEEDFDEKLNYLPLIVDGLTKMDRTKEIKFAIDLPKTPVVFVWYIAKVIKESGADIKLYHREDSETLRTALEPFDILYRNLDTFP